jgi:hypothetical protein
MEKRILILNKKGGGISWRAHCDFSNLLCGVAAFPRTPRYWRPQHDIRFCTRRNGCSIWRGRWRPNFPPKRETTQLTSSR